MADLEKSDSKSTHPSDLTLDTNTAAEEQEGQHGGKEFQSINNATRVASRAGSKPPSLRSLARSRSNNGYGCDDIEDEVGVDGGDLAVVDEWEVKWEGGESDPLNPRSLSMFKKWIVVLIVSASSLCV